MESQLQKLYTLFYYLLNFPYTLKWEPGLQIHFSLKASSTQYKLWYLACCVLFCHMILVWAFLVRLLPGYFANMNYDKLAFHSIWAVCSISTMDHQLIHMKQPEDVMQVANGTVQLVKNLEAVHFQPGSFKKSQLVRTRILSFLGFECVTSWMFFILVYYIFIQDFWQLGSFLYRLILILGGGELLATFGLLVDLWHLYMIWGSYLIALHINLGFMHTFRTAIELLLTDNFIIAKRTRAGQRRVSSMDCLMEQLLIYRKLRILTTVFNGVFGALYVPSIKSCCVTVCVLSVFISVRLAPVSTMLVGLFGISCTIMCTFCLYIFIMFMAMVNEYSVKFGQYLRSRKLHGAIGRRLVRSYREEAVTSGNFYGIQRTTCLTILGLLSNVCGSVLISFKI